ncbi:hypothetical protein CC80DRAFT_535616 [Byssothecium circinans]|uniref:Uncharacterized protein n=1 Tax=Byssothecium circinans TaxID=147558 RepID=A0A6A5TTJ1_9PLEO|nr:hypothetical protein CC80DRAFT_535616 [Byssothecium circinans]
MTTERSLSNSSTTKPKASDPQVDHRRNEHVHRLENGLVSLNLTPKHLVAAAKANSTSRLLSLPGEIRLKIYEYALGNLFFEMYEGDIFFVSRQIYSETAILPYKLTVFHFQKYEGFLEWMDKRKPAHAAAIQHLGVEPRDIMLVEDFPLDQLKDWFPNLKTINGDFAARL